MFSVSGGEITWEAYTLKSLLLLLKKALSALTLPWTITFSITTIRIVAIREGHPEREIDIKPFNIGYHRRYGTMVPARVCAEDWHLWDFCREGGNEL